MSDFPERPPTAACKPSVKVCRACLEEAIKIEMGAKMWNHISSSILVLAPSHSSAKPNQRGKKKKKQQKKKKKKFKKTQLYWYI